LLYESRCKELGLPCKVEIVKKSKDDISPRRGDFEIPIRIHVPNPKDQLSLSEDPLPIIKPVSVKPHPTQPKPERPDQNH
jgi:hypothetical protein